MTVDTFLSPTDQRLLSEQTRMLYAASLTSAVVTLLNAGILIAVLWSVSDQTGLLIWYAAIWCVAAARMALNVAYRRVAPDKTQAYVWAMRFVIGTVCMALLWAMVTIFFFPRGLIEYQVFLAFIVMGMSAGAVTTLSYLKTPIVVYLSCAILPVGVQFFLSNSHMSWPIAVMSFLFFFITLASALRIYHSTATNIRMRYQAASSERALRESEERYRMMFEAAPLGVLHYDSESRVMNCNPIFERFLGESCQSVLGVSMLQRFVNPEVLKALKRSLRGELGVYTGDMSVFGSARPLPVRIYFRGIVTELGEVTGGVAMIEDRSEDLRIARLKNEFVSTVSHELRTPLTAIKGSLDILSSGAVDDRQPLRNELMSNARRNSDRLLLLINDILDIDKIEQGALDYKIEPMAVMPFIKLALEHNQPYGDQYDVTFSLGLHSDDCWIEADSERLMQVMSNLLSNAAKFSPLGGVVTINVKKIVEDQMVCISVEDQGVGVPDEFQSKIFDKFSQYDGSDMRKAGGTGLGLNIAKAIVEHHHGQLTLTSKSGQGSRFYVCLPILSDKSV